MDHRCLLKCCETTTILPIPPHRPIIVQNCCRRSSFLAMRQYHGNRLHSCHQFETAFRQAFRPHFRSCSRLDQTGFDSTRTMKATRDSIHRFDSNCHVQETTEAIVVDPLMQSVQSRHRCRTVLRFVLHSERLVRMNQVHLHRRTSQTHDRCC